MILQTLAGLCKSLKLMQREIVPQAVVQGRRVLFNYLFLKIYSTFEPVKVFIQLAKNMVPVSRQE